ncbi:RnfABCDGE type electron transport complex subunit D [Candidatus Margulisiibacteriota bacterium]
MKFLITPAPHQKDKVTIEWIMHQVVLALLPAVAASVYFFGLRALVLIVSCSATAMVTEIICLKIMKSKTPAKGGGSIITGLLLAMTLPPSFPIWAAILGTIFAIVVGKQLFGGLGYNIFNPALIGRAFLAAAFPVHMTTWVAPFVYRGLDAVSSATPLALMKFQQQTTPYLKLFLGNVSGSLGETSALLILLGGLFLWLKGVIHWRVPISYIGTVALLGAILGQDPLFHVLAGGLMLGAWFMATDYVTKPLTKKGMWIFGVGAGVLVVVIRLFSGLPEGVMYSILIMNAFVPLINRYTRPRILGRKK